jgi:hypothetical protein
MAAAGSVVASGGVITQYSDRTLFNTAVGPVTVEDFTSTAHFPINPGILNSSTNCLPSGSPPVLSNLALLNSTNVTGPGNDFNIDFGGTGGFVGGFLDSIVNIDGAATRPLTAVFDGPVTAFGFDTSGFLSTMTESIQINSSTGAPFNTTLHLGPALDPTFFGFQSSTQDIVSVVLQ